MNYGLLFSDMENPMKRHRRTQFIQCRLSLLNRPVEQWTERANSTEFEEEGVNYNAHILFLQRDE